MPVIRRKKKADSVEVHFVEKKLKKGVKVRKVKYPFTVVPTTSSTARSPASNVVGGDGEGPSSNVDCNGQDLYHSSYSTHEVGRPVSGCTNTYRARKEKAAEAWAEIRQSIVESFISGLAFHKDCICVFCNKYPATIFCPDCGTNAYLCESCTTELHEVINQFHTPLIWKASNIFKFVLYYFLLYSSRKRISCMFRTKGALLFAVHVTATTSTHEKLLVCN